MKEVKELLKTAWTDNENLMYRGSIGQSVGVIILEIPKHEQILYEIVIDNLLPYELRIAALALVDSFALHLTLKKLVANFETINWDNINDYAQWLLHYDFESLEQ